MNTLFEISLDGSLLGNLTGTLYYIYFQAAGLLLAQYLLSKKSFAARLLFGSVLGNVLLMWLPALFAFFFDFSVAAHILAALSCLILLTLLALFRVPHAAFSLPTKEAFLDLLRRHRLFLFFSLLTFLLFCILLSTHTLAVEEDGLHTGQCTYGDMNVHLGFLTSIAVQGTFPPEYSISPGDKLCYPFLCDSISSSIYIWGASLRYAYLLPMYLTFLQVMTAFYCFALSWLQKPVKAFLAWFFFFFNGGLGIVYFFDWSYENDYSFRNIFTEYYQTPTNLINNNIRWVNLIVDMLLPQRATLFGYAVLFTCLWLLFRAVYQKEKDLFPAAALLGGALPMIHTHSFLALALTSSAFLLMQLYHKITEGIMYISLPFFHSKSRFTVQYPGKLLLFGFLTLMSVLHFFNTIGNQQLPDTFFLRLCLLVLFLLVSLGIWCLCRYCHRYGIKELLSTWGLYLIIILLLALPQLFYWTFGRVSTGSFTTGHFNWANQGDPYLWFYFKNWGIICLLLVPAILYASRKNFSILTAGFLIWFVAELIAFSPNTYDNNKLIYVAYGIFCCISAEYGYDLYIRSKNFTFARVWAIPFLLVSCISALLSLGRELISDYTVYSNGQIETARYIEQNAPKDATVLTSDRHVNEIAALTGRNIVSGSALFLSQHGVYQADRAADVQLMFENPSASLTLFEQYDVDYITISSWERNSYSLDEATFDALFPVVFEYEDIKLYKVN